MFVRGLTVCSILVAATVAQGGVVVTLVPTPNQATYAANSVVDVAVQLSQTPGAGVVDLRARLIEFDLAATSAFLLPGITLPLTHDRGDPQTANDVNFWVFSSLPECVITPSFCGFNHYIDDDLPPGPVDTRANILAIAYHNLIQVVPPQDDEQILVRADGTPVIVGRLRVTLPGFDGTYPLNVLNQSDGDASNRRARFDHGFDPHVTWRAGLLAPNDVSGGVLNLTVGPVGCPEVNLTTANPADEKTLPWTRFHTIRLTFGGVIPVDVATKIEINELVAGGTFGANLNTAGNFTFTIEPGNILKIGDTGSHLTNQKWYAVRNIAADDCIANFQVDYLVQFGDANNDCRVLFTDMGFINAQIPTTPALDDARRDINRDGSILFTDLGATNPRIPADCIVKPCGHNTAPPCP